jgi:hypothetical protein
MQQAPIRSLQLLPQQEEAGREEMHLGKKMALLVVLVVAVHSLAAVELVALATLPAHPHLRETMVAQDLKAHL